MLRFAPVVALAFIGTAAAHVPSFDEAGATLADALVVDDATKSWVVFKNDRALQDWYRFDLDAGDRLFISIATPASETAPVEAWLFMPGSDGVALAAAPPGTSAFAVPARDEVVLEPFTVVAMRTVAGWDSTVTQAGTHYILVRSEAPHVSVALGAREVFTPAEWSTIPVQRVAIQQWGGVPAAFAVFGEVVGLVAAAYASRGLWGVDTRRLLGVLGAGAVAGTALSLAVMAVFAAGSAGLSGGFLIAFLLAAFAVALGFGAWRVAETGGSRVAMALLAAGAVVVWAGLLVGPAMLAAWAAWPPRDAAAPSTAVEAPTEPDAPASNSM